MAKALYEDMPFYFSGKALLRPELASTSSCIEGAAMMSNWGIYPPAEKRHANLRSHIQA
jgi:hypothetical protein